MELSKDSKRNNLYLIFLKKFEDSNKSITVRNVAQFGYKLMGREKIHPHFFKDHSLKNVALHLTFFALKLPYDYANPVYLDKIITKEQAQEIIKLYKRRITERVPLEYITNEAYYLGHKFYVNEHVLVPRSLMNTRFSDFLKQIKWTNHKVLDLCTGSGCIGITLALLNKDIEVDLADISEEALAVAKINIDAYQLQSRVKSIRTNLFEVLDSETKLPKYDLIISNPPYLTDKEYQGQPLEIKHEPELALRGGKTGLDLIEKILDQAKAHLNPEGILIVEVGHSAAKLLKKKYRHIPIKWYKSRPAGKVDILDKILEKLGLLDSIFVCRAQDLLKK